MNDFLIVIPAYNEESNLKRVIQSLKQQLEEVDMVIIDDGSTDNTARMASKMGVMVLSHPTNLGYISAVQTGFKFAEKKNYPYVILFDGDGQHDPSNIADFIDKIQSDHVDVVIGSRFLHKSKMKVGLTKRVVIQFFSLLIYGITKKYITDPTSGYKAYKAKVYRKFINSKDFYYDLPDSNFIIDILLQNFSIEEIPVNMYDREHGKSKIHQSGIKPFIYLVQTLLSILIVIIKNKLHRTGGKV